MAGELQVASLAVGTAAVQVPVTLPSVGAPITFGMKILGRAANSGKIYVGVTSGVTTSTGALVPNGDPGTTFPYVVPAQHFLSGGLVWLISDTSSQTVDWSVA
jgi:hypothetical protein